MLIKILTFCNILLMVNAKGCKNFLHELGDCQSKFMFCVTTNSVPVTMCNGCKLLYDDLLQTYDKLADSCNATYFDKDRINLVPSTEALLTSLWTKAYCDDCFNNNHSITFEDMYSNFNGCIERNSVKPCEQCKNEYMELNNFYLNLDRHNDGEVCFDIQDTMNRTRNKWSKELKCCLRQYNVLYFSITLGITTCITLLFYCGTYLLTKRQERNHGILNDEDPLFNSPSSSSSATLAHPNISNNQRQMNTSQLHTNQVNNIEVPTSQIYEEEIKKPINNTAEETEDSSDDEPLVGNYYSMVKEKLK